MGLSSTSFSWLYQARYFGASGFKNARREEEMKGPASALKSIIHAKDEEDVSRPFRGSSHYCRYINGKSMVFALHIVDCFLLFQPGNSEDQWRETATTSRRHEREHFRSETIRDNESFSKRAAIRNFKSLGRFTNEQVGLMTRNRIVLPPLLLLLRHRCSKPTMINESIHHILRFCDKEHCPSNFHDKDQDGYLTKDQVLVPSESLLVAHSVHIPVAATPISALLVYSFLPHSEDGSPVEIGVKNEPHLSHATYHVGLPSRTSEYPNWLVVIRQDDGGPFFGCYTFNVDTHDLLMECMLFKIDDAKEDKHSDEDYE
ncbi:hypothetical protein JOM56_008119 [Amanita muscaria]